VIDQGALTERLAELVRVASPTGDESEVVDLVAGWMVAAGADEVDRWTDSIDRLSADPDYPGIEVPRDDVPVVAGLVRGGAPGPRLVLTGHLDTVPVGDVGAWSVDPLGGEVRDGALFGRGACDMKAGIAVAVEVLGWAAAHRHELRGELAVVAVPGEEDGGSGTLAAIRRGWTGDAAIVLEPSSEGGHPELVLTHAGALTFSVTVKGRAAHAAMRTEGESALDRYQAVHRAMAEDEAEVNRDAGDPLLAALDLPYPTSVGRIEGGDWASTVMDEVTAEVRVGVRCDETPPEAARRFVSSLHERLSGEPWYDEDAVVARVTGGRFRSGRLAADHPLVGAVDAAASSVTGARPAVAARPFGCDMGAWIDVAGVPALVYGPGDVRLAHAADERVPLDQVALVAEVVRRMALDLSDTLPP
jgi:acetylornithine deacetylase